MIDTGKNQVQKNDFYTVEENYKKLKEFSQLYKLLVADQTQFY